MGKLEKLAAQGRNEAAYNPRVFFPEGPKLPGPSRSMVPSVAEVGSRAS